MRASLLFYSKLRKELEKYKFVVNPYDPCVANMIMKGGKQLMVVWHVDDLMALCKDNFELTMFSCYLGNLYGPKLSMPMGLGITTLLFLKIQFYLLEICQTLINF
jgi:hypothetical protein